MFQVNNFSLFDNDFDENKNSCENGQSTFKPRSSVQYDSGIR